MSPCKVTTQRHRNNNKKLQPRWHYIYFVTYGNGYYASILYLTKNHDGLQLFTVLFYCLNAPVSYLEIELNPNATS